MAQIIELQKRKQERALERFQKARENMKRIWERSGSGFTELMQRVREAHENESEEDQT